MLYRGNLIIATCFGSQENLTRRIADLILNISFKY